MLHRESKPRIALAHPTLFARKDLELYEERILGNTRATEADASRFFLQHPNFLLLGQGARIEREVVLHGPSAGKSYRVDFFRRSYGKKFWDIIELKRPQTPFIVGVPGKHPRESMQVTSARNQAQDYRDSIIQNPAVREKLAKRGILVYRPQILVVVGKETEEVSRQVMEVLYDRLRSGPVEVWSYTAIFNFACEHYEANSVIVMPGQFCSRHGVTFTVRDISLQDKKDADFLYEVVVEQGLAPPVEAQILAEAAMEFYTNLHIRIQEHNNDIEKEMDWISSRVDSGEMQQVYQAGEWIPEAFAYGRGPRYDMRYREIERKMESLKRFLPPAKLGLKARDNEVTV